MAPKGKAAKEEPPQEDAEPPPAAEPIIEEKCFKMAGQIYWGTCMLKGSTWIRHGSGRQIITAKTPAGGTVTLSEYNGNWEEDQMHGQGNYTWADGSTYEGGFANNDLHGIGRFVFPEGSTYEGCWHRGHMHGQGRFDSMFDGRPYSGRFARDCFQMIDGSWRNIGVEHRQAEKRAILQGDTHDLGIRPCTDQADVSRELKSAQEQGLVPFVLLDSTFQGSPLDFVESRSPSCSVSVREADVARRRFRDQSRHFYNAVRESLLTGNWLTVLFEDHDLSQHDSSLTATSFPPGQHVLPDSWRLSEFFSPFIFPLEAFLPKLFNGRGHGAVFLPHEPKRPMLAPSPVPSSGGEEVAAENAEPAAEKAVPAPVLEPKEHYELRLLLTATAPLPCGSPAELREQVVQRFGRHVPLHRTLVLVLGTDGPE